MLIKSVSGKWVYAIIIESAYADMIVISKTLQGMLGCSFADLRLDRVTSKIRGHDIFLVQSRPNFRTCASLFACYASSQWNKEPYLMFEIAVNIFKKQTLFICLLYNIKILSYFSLNI